jgi:hypothetical protein
MKMNLAETDYDQFMANEVSIARTPHLDHSCHQTPVLSHLCSFAIGIVYSSMS